MEEEQEQKVKQTVYAPHLKLSEIKGRSLMIHEGGDNYQTEYRAHDIDRAAELVPDFFKCCHRVLSPSVENAG